MAYCMYLRKSRKDTEAEMRGEGETLARHRAQLTELALRDGYNVTASYEEIGSADTIAARPQMQRLLTDVEAGVWEGVLCVEIERLARGNTMEQGLVAQTFKDSGTRIITPYRVYDPNNESDEEYFEFNLFMARREYKTTTRRLQAGRERSAKEGKYPGSRAVYGYTRYKLEGQKGWSLKPHPEQAPIVRLIFDLYGNQGVSSDGIANRLNIMGVKPPRADRWTASGVRAILRDPTYAGYIRWNQRKTTYVVKNGVRQAVRPLCANVIIARGLHEPLIDEILFRKVQCMFEQHAKRPKSEMRAVANPLAGFVKCGVCGRAMIMKPSSNSRPDMLHCSTRGCATTGIYMPIAEQAILDILASWVERYSVSKEAAARPASPSSDEIKHHLAAQISTLNRQLNNLHDLLEQGVYDASTFMARRSDLLARRDQLTAALAEANKPALTTADRIISILPRLRTVLDAYADAPTAEAKNDLLRSVISRVVYHKTHRCYRNENPAEYLTLDVFPFFVDE